MSRPALSVPLGSVTASACSDNAVRKEGQVLVYRQTKYFNSFLLAECTYQSYYSCRSDWVEPFFPEQLNWLPCSRGDREQERTDGDCGSFASVDSRMERLFSSGG
ncbi:hypothetical protein BV22DRAFT_13568 [Leucogyrophana mollusca]|uniref:Uncharacterized protein n=1 Tax=Leucogyrophana mollusca TaxID=85980 RepID=A0ACB8C031_9AGAM|nr:hypothetical protein BV22DRAFT_13568 [Leucogyrophana mollusca]